MTDIPDLPREPQRRSLLERASIVWIVPVAAVVVALAIAWQNYAQRGPVIEISFDDASGIREGETQLRYRDVAVGLVEDVRFTPSLDRVLVSVRIEQKEIAPFIDSEARFWVVQPEVSARGVSGLDTVLSGVFIEGVWDEVPAGFSERHEGLASAPLIRTGQNGLTIRLRAAEGAALSRDEPILFKGIEVGRVGTPELLPGGAAAETEALIYEPYAGLVTTATRFWDVSGFSFRLGAGGAELEFGSIASLVIGGITFDTVISGGVPVEDGASFVVFRSETEARNSLFSESAGPVVNLAVVFDDNVSGLAPGAPVELGGVQIGEVANVSGLIDEERFGDSQVRLLATLDIRPGQMGLESAGGPETVLDFLAERVTLGLRARLASASIFTAALKVELVEVPGDAPAELDRTAAPFPTLPTTDSDISDVTASAQGVLRRINDLPVEEVLARAATFLETATRLAGDEELGRVPGEVTGLLGEVRAITGSEALQGLPDQLQALAEEVDGALAEVREITGNPALEGVPEDVAGIAADVRTIVGSEAAQALPQGLEDLLAQLTETSDALDAILTDPETVALPAEARGMLQEVRGVTGSEALQGLPDRLAALAEEIDGALAEVRAITGDPALAEIPGEVSGLVADARAIVGSEAAQAIPDGVSDLIAQLSDTSASLDAILTDPATLALPEEARGLLTEVRTITGSEAVQALPAEVSGLITEVGRIAGAIGQIAADLQTARTVDLLVGAIDATTEAADAVYGGMEGVPELIENLNSVAQKADSLPVEQVAEDLSGALTELRRLLGSDETQALPASLNGTLGELEAAVAELRAGGTVENVNRTLASAGDAADAIATAAEELPGIAERLDRLLAQANATLAGYDQGSEFGRALRAALREVETAASSVRSFTRSLERRPNSLILGR